MIHIKNLNIKYNNKECIRDGEFIAYCGQITSIIGESGTGKSSLLYVISMLMEQSCDYYYNDELLKLNNQQKAKFRNQYISFITQNSLLIETMNVEKNIEFYLKQSDLSYTVQDLLDKVKMSNKKHAMPKSLSGGEKQRVAIACAIAKDSDIILGDELTSALDKENKLLIMDILRDLANQGKAIILVSHERNIESQSDRVYKIDHLELQLTKDSMKTHEKTPVPISKKKTHSFMMFELLYHSNKNTNLKRIMMSLLVMIILFSSVSIFTQSLNNISSETFSSKDISENKMIVINNESGKFDLDTYGYAIHYIDPQSPLSSSLISQINDMSHIESCYDYYTFSYTMTSGSMKSSHKMDIKVLRNGQYIEKHVQTDEDTLQTSSGEYPFYIIPFYQEEEQFQQGNGVYINTNMAYYYNIEVGDILELTINVPYAMQQSLTEAFDVENKPYYATRYLGEQVSYETTVLGIIESNSIFEGDIYLSYDIMQGMIDEMVAKYHNNEIYVDVEAEADNSKIIDLQPYAKTIFVDKIENVLQVQNDINRLSDNIVAYNEYQSVIELKEANDKLIWDTLKIAIMMSFIFIIGGIILECFYINGYQSTSMMLNLMGYDKREKQKINAIHAIWQIIDILFLSMIVYIIAGIPKMIAAIKNIDILSIYDHFPDIYLQFIDYAQFSLKHLELFVFIVAFIVILVNVVMNIYYDKKDLMKWIRKK